MNTKTFKDRVRVLGPSRAPIARIKGKTRFMMLVKTDEPATMTSFCETVMGKVEKKSPPGGVGIEIDRDPAFII